MDNQAWSWVLGLVGVGGFFLAGKKIWWAWYINIAAQFIWAAYAIITDQLGFLVSAGVYTVVFVRNAISWTKEHRKNKAVVPNAVDGVAKGAELYYARARQAGKSSHDGGHTFINPQTGSTVYVHGSHEVIFNTEDSPSCSNCKLEFGNGSVDAIAPCPKVEIAVQSRFSEEFNSTKQKFAYGPENRIPGIFFDDAATVKPEEVEKAWGDLEHGSTMILPEGANFEWINNPQPHYVHQSHILLLSDSAQVSCINCKARQLESLERPCPQVSQSKVTYEDDIKIFGQSPEKESVDDAEFDLQWDRTHSLQRLTDDLADIFWCVRCGIDTRRTEYALEDRCQGGALTHHYIMRRNPENQAIEKWREAY